MLIRISNTATRYPYPTYQGYGLTETCACAAVSTMEDNSTGRVGPPLKGVKIKLVNWEEGNYRVTDKPLPRGEIHVGQYIFVYHHTSMRSM